MDNQFFSKEYLVLVTVPELAENVVMMITDFRDLKTLVYKPTGQYIGINFDGLLRLGTGPLEMINGIWYTREDPEQLDKHKHVRLFPDLLTLELIK